MHSNLEKVRQKLRDGAYTCVVALNDDEYCSCERGVKPLISLLQSGRIFSGAFAADKTVGAGAAHLYVLIGVRTLWANVISVSAIRVLENNGIEVFYEECVPHIINRRGDGICPIEAAVADAKTSTEAYELILTALKRLAEQQKEQDTADAVRIFKALADSNRLEIMELLLNGEKCGCELLEKLNIGQPTLSHHMRILCESGLVRARKEGKWMYYSLSDDSCAKARTFIERYTLSA